MTSPSTSRAIRSTAIRHGGMSPARNAARMPVAKPTRWIPSSIRAGISPASPHRGNSKPTDPGCGRSLAAGRSIYRRHRACDPASALFPLLHPRHARDRPCRRSTSPSRACSRRAWSFTRPIAAARALTREWVTPADIRIEETDGKRRATLLSNRRRDRHRLDREDVEVEEKRRRSRTISSPPMAPIRLVSSCCPIRRPTATSSGRKPASKARIVSRSACGA